MDTNFQKKTFHISEAPTEWLLLLTDGNSCTVDANSSAEGRTNMLHVTVT